MTEWKRDETIESARMILGDCMDLMRDLPDKVFDLAIVDPPYGYGGVTYVSKGRIKAHGGFFDKIEITQAVIDGNTRQMNKVEVVHAQTSKETIRSFEEVNVSPPPDYFEELFRISRHQIIWGGNYFVLPPSRGFAVWRKTSVSEKFTMAMCEYAWVSFDGNSSFFEGAPQGNSKDPRIHPTQKPVALYKWLLSRYAKPGDRILDTHGGSGSSAIACIDLGYQITWIEKDEDYYDAAVRRVKEFAKQPRLIDAPQAIYKDADLFERP